MKTQIVTLILAAVTCAGAWADVKIDKPVKGGNPTAFAIITDKATYEATAPAMKRYRDAVEADGLDTYIVSDEWADPTAVREAIKKLYASEPRLEGMVFVGDVPIAMVRNGQHFTTAFKMDEDNFPIHESSVPSDRFYDCLDLEFRFLQPDTTDSALFYYELTEDCPQKLEPTFYSARIRYPKERGGDKYEAISRFLDKAAQAKADMKNDCIDRVVSFNGHGYNSDCLIAWMDEEKAYRENFPEAFKTATGFKHWNFRMAEPMKYKLMEELERPGTDVFMFHEHGGPTTQYINGYGEAKTLDERMHHLRTSLYSLVRYRVKYYDDNKDSLQTALIKEFNLAPDYFAGMENDSIKKADSAERAEKDMYANEFHNRTTMPRFVMFDACYNGSFHEDDYIAGEYIFNPGNTLAAQGNTRNVLQDRWTIEMIGLLSHGVRAGQYNRLVATLEGHLIGDPTMHFAPIGETATLSADMTTRRGDREYWMQQLESPWADVRSIAVRMLSDIEPEATWSPRLLEIYRTDAAGTTRMEALKMLSRYCNADFKEAVRLGLNDPYERIARWSAALAAEIGDTDMLPDYIAAYIDGNERQRVHYTLGTNMVLFPKEDVRKAIEEYYANNTRYNADKEKATVLDAMEYYFKETGKELDKVKDKSLAERRRISPIRHVRNNPYTYNIDDYIAVVADDENPEGVRVNMAEALGWFNYSSRKGEIVAAFEKMLAENSLPDSVRAEMVQTINRLK